VDEGAMRDPRSENPDLGHPDSLDELDEEEMDVAAEQWARELMR